MNSNLAVSQLACMRLHCMRMSSRVNDCKICCKIPETESEKVKNIKARENVYKFMVSAKNQVLASMSPMSEILCYTHLHKLYKFSVN